MNSQTYKPIPPIQNGLFQLEFVQSEDEFLGNPSVLFNLKIRENTLEDICDADALPLIEYDSWWLSDLEQLFKKAQDHLNEYAEPLYEDNPEDGWTYMKEEEETSEETISLQEQLEAAKKEIDVLRDTIRYLSEEIYELKQPF